MMSAREKSDLPEVLGLLKKKLGHGCQKVPFAQATATSRILEGL